MEQNGNTSKLNPSHLLHDATKRLCVAAVDESVSNHSAALVMEESREQCRALTHITLHCQDPLKHNAAQCNTTIILPNAAQCNNTQVQHTRHHRKLCNTMTQHNVT